MERIRLEPIYKLHLSSGFRALATFFIFVGVSAWAAGESPQNFTVQGRFLNAAGTAPLTSVVDLTLGIYNPAGDCLLYEESQANIDLSLTDGMFAVSVGSVTGALKRTASDPNKAMAVVFANAGAQIRAAGANCASGYTPSAGDVRTLRVTVSPHSGVPFTLSPDQVIESVPQSMVAETLQGIGPTGFLQPNAGSNLSQVTAQQLTSGVDASTLHHHDSIYAKLNNSSSIQMAAGSFVGLGTRAADPAGLTAADVGKTWYDTTSNVVKFWDGSAVKTLGVSGAYLTALTGDVTATGPGSAVATVASVGGVTAANVASGANLANAATSNNTASTIVKRDASGNFSAGVITLGTDGLIVGTNQLVTAGGNVGIGTATPTAGARLDVTGTGVGASSIIIPRDTTANRPTVGVNGMMRYNTTNNKFEVYENGAWVNAVSTGVATSVSASAGSAAAPSISFSGDSDTGFYSNGANVIGIATNGTNVFNVSTTSISSPTTGGALITSGNGTAAAPAFSFAGDTGSGWFRPAASTVAVSTGGTERARIDSSGNVGIGTTTPTAKLDVAGDIRIGNSSAVCDGTTVGSQRYNSGTSKMQFCNGTAWADIDTTSGGTVTSVTASLPLSSSGGTTPNISIADATTGAKGVVQVGSGLNVASGTVSVDAGTTANKIVQLDGSAKLPAVDGSALTNIVATNVSGTVAIGNGGTGATTAAGARTNLGLGSAAVANLGTGSGDLTTNTNIPNCLSTQKLQMSAGPVYTFSCVADPGSSALPLAGGTMTGAINMGGNDLTAVGNIVLNAQKSINLGTYTDAQESTFASGLVAGDKGKAWFNTTSNQVKYWDGSAVKALGISGAGLTSLGGQTGSSQTFAIGTSGNSPAWSSASDVHTLNIPMASTAAVTAGLISKSDYDSFNTKVNRSGDTMSGALAMGTNKITGLGNPTTFQDAATKIYVDSNLGGATLDLTGQADGKVIKWDGTNSKWVLYTPSSGSVTSVTASLPLSSSGGATPNISIADATTGAKGVVQVGSGLNVASGTVSVDTGTIANKIVQLDGSAKLPAVDGSALTNIVATNVSGTVAIGNGGTGATTAAGARTNLGLGSAAVANLGTGSGDLTTNTNIPNCLSTQKLQMSAGPVYTFSCVADPGSSALPLAGGTMTGAILLTAGSAAAPSLSFSGDTNTGIYSAGADTVNVATGGATRVTVDSSGNVGIGTTSPQFSLDVNQPAVGTSAKFGSQFPIYLTPNWPSIGFNGFWDGTNNKFGAGSVGHYMGYIDFAPASGNMTFSTSSAAGNAGANATTVVRMTLSQAGNVGIGLADPSEKLQVYGGTGSYSGIKIGGNTAGNTSGVLNTSADSGGYFRIQSISSEGSTYGNLILNNLGGNVGIGTTTPTTGTRLDITGTGAAASSIIIPRDTVANRPTTGVNGMIRYASDTNKFEAYENGAWINMIGGGAASSVAASAGTAASPSMSFSGDTNTGFYSNGADTIGISTNGTNVFNISTTSISSPTTGGALITSGNGTAAAPAFSFTGDTGTGWFRPAASTLAASTAGTERMRIDSSGNVGIGTTSPGFPLTVSKSMTNTTVGSLQNTSATGYSGFRLYDEGGVDRGIIGWANGSAPDNGGALIISTRTTDYISLVTDGARRVKIDAVGNVSIGGNGATSNPVSLLDVVGTTGAVQTLSRDNATVLANDTIGKIQFWNNDTQLTTQKIYGNIEMQAAQNITTDAAAGNMIFRTTGTTVAGSPVERMRIDSTGNVGIGTTSPGSRLHVPWLSGDTTASAQFGSNNASNNQIAIFAESRTNTGIYSSSVSGIGVHAVSATGRGLNAEATGSGLGAHISSVSGTGAVIRSASNISALIQSDSTTNTSPTLVVQRTGTATGDLFQAQDDVGTSLVKITSTGNVGIGTTTPTAILHVVGGRPIFSHDSGNHNLQLSAPGTNGGDWSMGVSDDTNGIGGGKKFFLTPDINDSIASVFTVLPTGRIGMGSNSPTTGTRLDIVGTTSADSSIIIPRATVANRPTTGVNGMIRYASDTNKFEAYENGAWINMIGGGAASSVAASAGTAASPSMSFSGDTNTGFYSNGADTIGVSTNGTNVFNISTTSISSPTTGGALMTSGNGTAAAPTFSFAGDPDTGWFRPAANTMAASTAGTERMRIDSSGNVGIGATASANRRLEVVGSTVNDSIVKIRNSNATGVSGIQFNDDGDNWQDFIGHANSSHPAYANKFVISTNTSDVSFIMGDTGGVAGTEKMTIKNSGNVGIGTTTPSSLFDISSSAGGVFTLSRNSGAILQGDTIGKIQFWNNDVSLTTQKIYGSIEMEAAQNISSDAARGSIIFKTTGASAGDLPTERMRIDASGISIGTINATPVYPLQVSSRGTAGADSYFLTLTDTRPAAQANISAGDGVSLRFSTVSDTIGLATIHALATTNGASNADLVFQTNNGTNRTEKMRITAGGNVGIGTTSPGTKLQINGPWVNGEGQLHIVADTGSDAMVSTTADSGKESGLLLAHDSGGVDKEWWVYSSNNFGSDDFKIAETTTGPSWPVRLTIKKGGNVGIGNTAPAKLLHVGSASVASATAVANFQNADGTCTITPAASGSGIACSSDERLKENFRDVSGEFALDRILQLQAVTYNFKTSSDANRRTGYKAQEVQKIAPEFVRENEDGFLQVYYDAFIPWITEAIKTLYSRIVGIEDNQAVQARQIASKADKTETEALKAENAQLKQENAEIKARLERIEKALNSK